MLAILLTLLALAATMALAHALAIRGLGARALFAGTLAATQIIATQTLLGAVGLLTRPAVAGVNLLLSAALLAVCLRCLQSPLRDALREDLEGLRASLRALRHPEIASLGLLALVAGVWVLAAILYLHPRSVDDLAHHLPPILEAAVRGHFLILPLELRLWFAYPLNADLLFLWPTILRGDIHWADGAQAATALLAALGVIALAREIGASRRAALFGALLLLLFPVTLRQATSCYTDITLAAFYGAAVWGALRHARDGAPGPLLLSGAAAGLLAGTKYHFLFPLLALLPLALLGVRHAATPGAGLRRFAALFVLPSAALSGYWYIRNLVQLGNPFFPYRLGLGDVTIFPSSIPPDDELLTTPTLLSAMLRNPRLPFGYSMRDAGVGGVDGGLSPLFWGAVVLLGLWVAAHSLLRLSRERDPLPPLLALQFPAAMMPYLVTPGALLPFTTRYMLAAAVIGLAFLARGLDVARQRWPAPAALAAAMAVAASAVSMTILGGARDLHERKQKMLVGEAISAHKAGRHVSTWRFVEGGSHGTGRFAAGWDLLDLLSHPPGGTPRPLWIYATGQYPSGFYGTWLQNRIWNFGAPGRPDEAEVFFYYLTIKRRIEDITYYGEPRITFADAVTAPDRYTCVLVTPETLVFIRSDLVAPGGGLHGRLVETYEKAYPEEIATASTLTPVPASGTIINSGPVGIGLKWLELTGRMGARVILSRPEDTEFYRRTAGASGPVYIVGRVGQTSARLAGTLSGTASQLALYEISPDAPPIGFAPAPEAPE